MTTQHNTNGDNATGAEVRELMEQIRQSADLNDRFDNENGRIAAKLTERKTTGGVYYLSTMTNNQHVLNSNQDMFTRQHAPTLLHGMFFAGYEFLVGQFDTITVTPEALHAGVTVGFCESYLSEEELLERTGTYLRQDCGIECTNPTVQQVQAYLLYSTPLPSSREGKVIVDGVHTTNSQIVQRTPVRARWYKPGSKDGAVYTRGPYIADIKRKIAEEKSLVVATTLLTALFKPLEERLLDFYKDVMDEWRR